jgi:hypothetical protein
MRQALFQGGGNHHAARDAGDDQGQAHAAETERDVGWRGRGVAGLQRGDDVAAAVDQLPHKTQQAPPLRVLDGGFPGGIRVGISGGDGHAHERNMNIMR